MNDSAPASPPLTWDAAACPFTIETSARVLDDIRLAVVDAFFSLPKGGVEIGGILLGSREQARLRISDYAPLECEHAHGPTFTLSARDEARLRDLLKDAPARFPGLQPLGWYHSHTRSEIFLSDPDLEIHRRLFPEPWHVALVLKPHTFQPTRAGFFFRERDGKIQSSAPYSEFVVGALPMQPVPLGGAPVPPPLTDAPATIRLARNPEIGVPEAVPAKPAVPAEPAELPAPQFLTETSSKAGRWAVTALGIAAAGAVGFAAYQTQSVWRPKVTAAVRPASARVATHGSPAVGLNLTDKDGQLQVFWDRSAPAVRRALGAILEISDGGPRPQSIVLDTANLQNGFFAYGRQSERVDVSLILRQPDGPEVREVTTFFGRLPGRRVNEDPEVRKQRDQLAAEAERLKLELNSQAARARKLEKDLKSAQDELRNQQQRRLTNQLPDGKQ